MRESARVGESVVRGKRGRFDGRGRAKKSAESGVCKQIRGVAGLVDRWLLRVAWKSQMSGLSFF